MKRATPLDKRLFKLGGHATRVLRLAVNKRRNDPWMAVAHMGFFAIYHKEHIHPWTTHGSTSGVGWVEKQRIGRRTKYNGAATYAKLADFTFMEGQAVIRAMDRRIRASMTWRRASMGDHLTDAVQYGSMIHKGWE